MDLPGPPPAARGRLSIEIAAQALARTASSASTTFSSAAPANPLQSD